MPDLTDFFTAGFSVFKEAGEPSETGLPQTGQKAVPSSICAPHPEHKTVFFAGASTFAPHIGQKAAPSDKTALQFGQVVWFVILFLLDKLFLPISRGTSCSMRKRHKIQKNKIPTN